MKLPLDKLGGIGAVVAAAACPICFPKLALVGAFFGLGALGAYEYQFLVAAQALVAIALVGHVLAYLRHRRAWLLASAVLGGAAVFSGLYVAASELLVYLGLATLLVTATAEFWRRSGRERGAVINESTITCPRCGAGRKEVMPTDNCQFFYECGACETLLRPKPGDCCVFCSYGSVKCPPMQAA